MTEPRASQPLPEPAPAKPPKATFNRSVQRTMVVELVLGGLAMVVLLMVAGYFGIIRPRLQNSPALVRPTLDAFMVAGGAGDVAGAHHLFSRAGLRSVSRDDLAAMFSDRSLFDGFQRFQFTAYSRLPAGAVTENELVTVEAAALYQAAPPATLSAELEFEDEDWRLRSIDIHRPEAEPALAP